MSEPHWMTRALRAARAPGADELEIPHGLEMEAVWGQAAETTGWDMARIAEALARFFRLPVADLEGANPGLARLVPGPVALEHTVLPVGADSRRITVAVADPASPHVERAVGFVSGRAPRIAIAPLDQLRDAIHTMYSPDRAVASIVGKMSETVEAEVEVIELETIDEGVDLAAEVSGPAIRLVNLMIGEAIEARASDIHVQPTESGGAVRYRVDGVLRNVASFAAPVMLRVISRIKVMGGMDIADRLRPQDGRATVRHRSVKYDLRISTVPAGGSEKSVIRILNPTGGSGVDGLGMHPADVVVSRELLDHRTGIVVVTGPTGSGKTTALYAALKELHTEAVNIMTVEDPVEYELPGLTQIAVDPRKGVTFASALRAILRQDPDVIFVGEIRDPETAAMAAQAALTGHLVLATVHANDSTGAIRRLTDLGLDAATVTQTLRGSVAQRLVRGLCTACREPVEELTSEEAALVERLGTRPRYRAGGCAECGGQGYTGRFPVNEVMRMTPALEALVLGGSPSAELVARAREDGTKLLLERGLQRMEAGDTSLEEIARVLGTGDGAPEVEAAAEVETAVGVTAAVRNQHPLVAMVVEDDPFNRLAVAALLAREGFETIEAADGDEALELLLAHPEVGLMVLDLDLPTVSGQEVLARVRSTLMTSSLIVIVLTASTSDDTEFALLEAGADDYLRKPIEPRLFSGRIRAAMRRAHTPT